MVRLELPKTITKPNDLAFLADEDNYAIRYDEEEVSFFGDGTHVVVCTSWAKQARRLFGERATIHGFSIDENPSSKIAQDHGGHDFAIVDGRWIVDGWIINVESYTDSPVLDLEDPADAEIIASLYGDRTAWDRTACLEREIDGESDRWRAKALAGTAFEHLSRPRTGVVPRP